MGWSVHPGHLLVDPSKEFFEAHAEPVSEEGESRDRRDGVAALDCRDECPGQRLTE
jgi:hypothetical protein